MSREPQSSSQPVSNGGADLTAPLPTEQSLPSAPSANDPALSRLLGISRAVSIVVVSLLVVAVPITLFTSVAKESGKRKCGVDWMLWLAGSDETFESAVQKAIEKGQKESPFPDKAESPFMSQVKPFEFKEFKFDGPILYKPDE